MTRSPVKQKHKLSNNSPRKQSSQQNLLNPSLPRMPSFPSLTLTPFSSSSSKNTIIQQNSYSSLALSISTDGEETDEEEVDERKDERRESIPKRRIGDSRLENIKLVDKHSRPDSRASGSNSISSTSSKGKEKENVVVCLRVRPTVKVPTSPIYVLDPASNMLKLTSSHPTLLKRGAMTKNSSHHQPSREDEYTFDALHISPMPTSELYFKKIKPVVQAAMEGFNGTVFAYGQTASGKTHTMMGTDEEAGIIPLAIEELFAFISDQGDSRSYALRVQFLEIYNEQLRDLLCDAANRGGRPLDVTGDEGKVAGLTAKSVNSSEAVMEYLEEGDRRRRVGATDWNERSSRSHCVFTVTIESTGLDDRGLQVDRSSRLNLIDLAGSESATSSGDRQKEGSFINKSLLALGTVISKLTEAGPATHVPYRDSKLTRLLQPALSGKSKVAIICTVSPDQEQATETVSTLKFAKRAKMIETKAERSVEVGSGDMMLHRVTQDGIALALKIELLETKAAKDQDELASSAVEKALQAAEITRQNLEIQLLKDQFDAASAKITTKVSIDAHNRRTSGGGLGLGLGTPGRRIGGGGIGLNSPRTGLRVFSENILSASPRFGSMEKEIELENKIEQLVARLDSQTLQATESYQELETATSARLAKVESERAQFESDLASKTESLLAMEKKWKVASKETVDARLEKKSTHQLWKKATIRIDELESSAIEVESFQAQLLEAGIKYQSLLDQESKAGASGASRNLELESELKNAKFDHRKSEKVIEGLRIEINELNAELLSKISTISNLERNNQKALASFEELTSANAANASKAHNILSKTIKELEQALEEMTKRYQKAQKVLDQTASNESEVEDSRRAVRKMEDLVDDTKEELLVRDQELQLLKSSNSSLQNRIDSYNSVLAGRTNSVQGISQRIAVMTGKTTVVDPNSVEGLSAAVTSLQTENFRLKEIIAGNALDVPSLSTRASLAEVTNSNNLPSLPTTRSRTTSSQSLRTKHESAPSTRTSTNSFNSSNSINQQIQPLPCSPKTQESTGKKMRRKTVERDMIELEINQSVGKVLASPMGRGSKRGNKGSEIWD